MQYTFLSLSSWSTEGMPSPRDNFVGMHGRCTLHFDWLKSRKVLDFFFISNPQLLKFLTVSILISTDSLNTIQGKYPLFTQNLPTIKTSQKKRKVFLLLSTPYFAEHGTADFSHFYEKNLRKAKHLKFRRTDNKSKVSQLIYLNS